ncbi:hypothetical protein [Acidiferrobacter sp.]|jgi:regulator of extracellular matrix RemA (YlzA/DUF370 family)|uniref:hypothetical protein n=1 Tax=Acidiferrobacter sp. TaxID=1872107 RepID=UPI00260273B4|nr:hypothetical protein [Acidiferrobacter sp.]
MLLESVFALFKSVPAIFYAITTGSTITLSGLYMQNRSESERNTERLRHDALMRDRERDMALRREVYLKSAEALAHAQEYLAAFARDDLAADQHEALIRGIGGDLNKVHIVGSLATVQAIVEANEFFVRSVADLGVEQLPVKRLKEEIKAEEFLIEAAGGRRDEALTRMREMDRAQATESAFWTVQNQILTEAHAAMEDAAERLRELRETLLVSEARLLRDAAHAGIAFGTLVVRANVAIRRELEMPLDTEAYLGLMERSQETLARNVGNFQEQAIEDRRSLVTARPAPARGAFVHWFGRQKEPGIQAVAERPAGQEG